MGSKFGVKSKMMICSKQNVQAINEQAPDLIAKVTLYGEEACKGAKIIQPGDLCKCVGCPVGIGERIDAWLQIGDFDLQSADVFHLYFFHNSWLTADHVSFHGILVGAKRPL